MRVLSFERRTQFFKDLENLMDGYPEIKGFLKSTMEEGDAEEGPYPEDYPEFDPDSPVTYNGVVLLVNICNMEYHEATAVLYPWTQSIMITNGLIADVAKWPDSDGG